MTPSSRSCTPVKKSEQRKDGRCSKMQTGNAENGATFRRKKKRLCVLTNVLEGRTNEHGGKLALERLAPDGGLDFFHCRRFLHQELFCNFFVGLPGEKTDIEQRRGGELLKKALTFSRREAAAATAKKKVRTSPS